MSKDVLTMYDARRYVVFLEPRNDTMHGALQHEDKIGSRLRGESRVRESVAVRLVRWNKQNY